MRMKHALASLLILVLSPVRGESIEGDENWSSAFALPGANSTVYATIEFEGDLIVGGAFSAIGVHAISRVARWNGSEWSPMGEGFDGIVRALAIHNGELYAGGAFDYSGSTTVSDVARWDGNAWQPLAQQIYYHRVQAMCSYDGDLIIGGIDNLVLDEHHAWEEAGVAAWDGQQWTELASFWSMVPENHIDALTVHSGNLIISGVFDELNGDSNIEDVARWNGYAWDDMGNLFHPNTLLVHEGELYAANSRIHHWTGSTWESLSDSPGGYIYDLVPYAGGLAAGGRIVSGDDTAAMFWDGDAWSQIGVPFEYAGPGTFPYLSTVAVHADQLIAGGSFHNAGGTAIMRLAAWDGTNWKALEAPEDQTLFNGLDSACYEMGVFQDQIVIGGKFDNSYGLPLNGIGTWTGTSWQQMGMGASGRWDHVTAFAEYQGELVVGGRFVEIGGVTSPNLAIWDGSGWQPFGNGWRHNCNALQVDGSRLYAAGGAIIECWNGDSWSSLDGGLNGSINTMILFDDDLIVGGSFTADSQGQRLSRVARWDGEGWHRLGQGLNDDVLDLQVWRGLLVAAGGFTHADGQPAEYLALWDGLVWQPLPSTPNGNVEQMAVFHGDLVVAGEFTEIEDVQANGIARWDGAAWRSFGQGLNGSYITDLFVHGDDLYVCGYFNTAGGKSSYGIACWTEVLTALPEEVLSSELLDTWNWPNPFNPLTDIRFTLPASSSVSIRVFAADGRQVRFLLDGIHFPAGDASVSWNGCNDAGQPLSSGVYFYEVAAGSGRGTQKMLLLK